MVRVIDSWWWIIPLNNNRTSVGVVLDAAKFKSSKLSPEEFFERAVAEQMVVADRIGNGRRVSEVCVAADFSYRMSSLAGERWLLAGDAAGFIDPVFSSGVFLAVFAGERAADVLNEVLDRPRNAKRLFAQYERAVNRAMDVYLRFVNAWFKKELHIIFVAPRYVYMI